MSNGSPAVAASASAGGGIALLRRQFELRVNATVYEASGKPPVKKRPASLRDPKTVFAKPTPDECNSVRSDHVHPLKPNPGEATSTNELTSSSCHARSTSLSSSCTTTSSSSTSLSSSQPAEDTATGRNQAIPQDPNDGQLEEIQEIRDEGTTNDFMGHALQNNDLTTTPECHPSDVKTSEDFHESTAEFIEAEMNDKLKTDDTSTCVVSTPSSDRSNETSSDPSCLNSNAGEFHIVSTSTCNPPELKSSTGVFKTAAKERDVHSAKQAECGAKRKLPEETLSSEKSPNSKIYLSPSASPRTKWMPVTRSMENLCSTSAGTPTKESSTFYEKKPKAVNVLVTAADVVTSSQSLDRSKSLANIDKPPIRAKKPPPPVPKKNVKFTEVPKSSSVGDHEIDADDRKAVDAETKEDLSTTRKFSSQKDNSSIPSEATPGSEGDQSQRSMPSSAAATKAKVSSEEDNSSIPSEATPGSEGDQSQRSVPSSAVAATKTKVTRPKSLFPPTQTMAGHHAVESNNDRYKSLPKLRHLGQIQTNELSPLCNRKDTLFPCNRQKLRPNVLLQSSQIGAALTPDFCQRSSVGESQSLLASPMSVGNRTPPGIDSVIANTEESGADGHPPSSVSSNCPLVSPLPAPVDSDMCHATTVRPNSALPSPSSTGETFDAASAAEQEMSDITPTNQFPEVSDADGFLDDAFEFLSLEAAQPIEDGMKTSPLKLWTDTWCKSSTNNSETPPRAPITGSKVKDSQKGNEKSTKDDSDQESAENSKLQTATKIEEDRQRMIEDKQDLNRKGSFALGGDRKAAPGDAKDAVVERPNIFGVVLRPKSTTSSLSRRSTFVSTIPNTSATDAPSSSTASSSSAATASELNRRSSAIFRTSSGARPQPLSRLPSLQSLTILPSNRPPAKVPGKYVGGKPSIFLDGTSSTKEDKKEADLETELDAIDEAFGFLDIDDSGA